MSDEKSASSSDENEWPTGASKVSFVERKIGACCFAGTNPYIHGDLI